MKQLFLQSTRFKCSQHNQKRNALKIEKKRLQIKKTTFVNLTTHTLQMLTTQRCVVCIFSVFLYLFVLWAFAPSAVKLMKIFS